MGIRCSAVFRNEGDPFIPACSQSRHQGPEIFAISPHGVAQSRGKCGHPSCPEALTTMRRRWVLIVTALVIVAAAVVLLEPTGVPRGFLRGEPFFEGRPASTWGQRLRDENPKVQADARRSLRIGGSAAVPVLAALVSARDQDWELAHVRIVAVDLLGDMGVAARDAIPALIEALADPDPTVCSRAAEALGAVGPDDRRVIFELIVQLNTPNAVSAARGLAKCGSAALPGSDALIALLRHADADVRWNAARTLGRIHAAKAVVPLIAVLKDPNDEVREHAAEALGDIGPEAAGAVDSLIATLKDANAKVRRDTARSLGQIGPAAKRALPALHDLAKSDPEQIVRDAAAKSVSPLGRGR